MANGGKVKGLSGFCGAAAAALSAHERMVRLPSSQMVTEVATVATSGFAVGIRT